MAAEAILPGDRCRARRPIIGAQPWLTTLADLISILLAFMVLTFAGIITTPVDKTPSSSPAAPASGGNTAGRAPPPAPAAADSTDYLALILGRTLMADAPSPGIVVRRSGDGLAIVIAAALLFPAGDSELTAVMAGRLRRLTPSLPPQAGPVQVFGVGAGSGTDADRELALQRALAVASVITSGPDRRPAVAYGFGSSAAALSWLQLAAASPAAPAATAIVMDAGGEAR